MFTHAGIKAKANVSTASSDDWVETLTNMLTYSCEYSHNNHKIKQDYENPSNHLPGAGGTMQESVQVENTMGNEVKKNN